MKRHLLRLFIQTVVCFAAALAIYLLKPVTPAYLLGLWAVMPTLGGASACAVTRRGINPYLSWIMPPCAMTLAGFITSGGYMPYAGSILLCALMGIIGAAAADVLNRKGGHK